MSVKDIDATEPGDTIRVSVNGEYNIKGTVLAYCNAVIKTHSVASPTAGDTKAVNAMVAFYEYYKAAVEYKE